MKRLNKIDFIKNPLIITFCMVLLGFTNVYAQNVGINENNPTNTLHIKPLTPTDEPLRIEGLKQVNLGDSVLLLVEPTTGVVRYLSVRNLADSLAPFLDLDTDIDSLVLNGNVLTVWEDGTSASVTFPPFVNTNDLDSVIGNEFNTTFVVNGSNLDITDPGGTLSVPLSAIGNVINVNDLDSVIGNEFNTAFAVNGSNLDITDLGGTLSVPLTSLGTDDQNLTSATLAGTILTITIENGTSVNIDLVSLVNDLDSDPTNEYNTTFAVNGSNLDITDGGGILSVPITQINAGDWHITGNTGTTAGTNFLGTLDNQDMVFKRNNIESGRLGTSNTSYGFNSLLNNTVSGLDNVGVGRSALQSNTTGDKNSALGYQALLNNTIGNANVAFGYRALRINTSVSNLVAIGRESLENNTTGTFNTAIGYRSLRTNTTGVRNTAIGYEALTSNINGDNTSVGFQSLRNNTLGDFNSALGSFSLARNTTGNANTAMGYRALFNNITGSNLTAFGQDALRSNVGGINNTGLGRLTLALNVSGDNNTAVGFNALANNTGSNNSAFGVVALLENTTGTNNTAVGNFSLTDNTTGSGNVAIGAQALDTNNVGFSNTAVGNGAMTENLDGDKNTALGNLALQLNTSGNDNTALGYLAYATTNFSNSTALGANTIINQNNKVRIGATTVTVVEGPVVYTTSDKRFKNNVIEEVKGLDFIMKLRPVVYNFDTKKFEDFLLKDAPDDVKQKMQEGRDYQSSTAIRQSGFIAQEVEAVANELNYNFNGVHAPESDADNYSLSYSTFVVPLVKAMQEQQALIENLIQENKILKERISKVENKN